MNTKQRILAIWGILLFFLPIKSGSAQEPPIYGNIAPGGNSTMMSDQYIQPIPTAHEQISPEDPLWFGRKRSSYFRNSGCASNKAHPFLNKHGLGCYAHHDQIGCSSFHSEFRFIFGSCRAFFGEPCNRGPYRIPLPDAGYPPSGSTPTDLYNPPGRYLPYGSQPYYTNTLQQQ